MMLAKDAGTEALRSENPLLANFIETKLKKNFPGIEEKFFTNWYHEGINVLGAAIKNTLYLDETKAVQSSYFHEIAHMYWDALPENDPAKKKLLKMFDTEEQTILAIGRAGVEVAETDFIKFAGISKIFTAEGFKIALKAFWRRVKRFVGISSKDDVAKMMASDIWSNKAEFTSDDFLNEEMKFMKNSANMSTPDIIRMANEKHKELIKKGWDPKDPVKMARFFIRMEKALMDEGGIDDINSIISAEFNEAEKTILENIGININDQAGRDEALKRLTFAHLVLKQYNATGGLATVIKDKKTIPSTGWGIFPFEIK